MAKAKQAAQAATTPAPAATTGNEVTGSTLVTLGAKAARCNENTKHGQGGTAGTYGALCAMLAANGGSAPFSAVQALCIAQGDKGFARYALRNKWLAPVQAAQ